MDLEFFNPLPSYEASARLNERNVYHDEAMSATSETFLHAGRTLVDGLTTLLLVLLVHRQCGNAFTQCTGDATHCTSGTSCTPTALGCYSH